MSVEISCNVEIALVDVGKISVLTIIDIDIIIGKHSMRADMVYIS